MELSSSTRVGELLQQYPFLLDFLVHKSPKFSLLRNPVLRGTLARVAPISQVAAIGGLDETELLFEIAAEIYRRANESVTVVSQRDRPVESPPETEAAAGKERIETLRDIVMRLHSGASPSEVREEFADLLSEVSPAEIGAIEQELVKSGVSPSEIKRLCELHVELFTSSADAPELPEIPPGHPLHTLRAENREAESRAAKLQEMAAGAGNPDAYTALHTRLIEGLEDLSQVIRHYERLENQLFPIMERHGITAPPQVMWEIHDDIRRLFKEARSLLEAQDPSAAARITELCTAVRDLVFKEERVLVPMVWELLDDSDWATVRSGEEEIGFAWVSPGTEWKPEVGPAARSGSVPGGSGVTVNLDVGRLSPEVINAILKTLPADLTFVDSSDRVAYYSATEDRIFPRSPGIIGREVEKCHPPDSVHVVRKIVDAFRSGERDTAEFWIESRGRFLHIRYFAVRLTDGTYAGCLEFTQDVTRARELSGEKRILNWE